MTTITIIEEDIFKKLLKIDNIVINKLIKLSSGQSSDYYVDIKKSYGEPRILTEYIDYMIELFGYKIWDISCVVGSGYGGVPLATAFSLRLEVLGVKLSLVRDNPKNHGKSNMIDGYIPVEDDAVLIVDDVFTTGGSIKKIIEVLPKDLNIKIFVICNRSGIENPEVNGIEVKYLFTAEELMKVMKK